MKKSLFGIPNAIAAALLIATLATPAHAQARRLLNHGAQGSVPSLTAKLTPVGPLDATNRLHLAIGVPIHNQAALEATLQSLYDPASPHYHQWLTPEQFAKSFGPTEQEYESVVQYMERHGLKVEARYSNRMLVSVGGAVPDIEKAFGVTMRVYKHPKENRTFYAADTAPSLDADVPVLGISGLDNYEPLHPTSLTKSGQSFTNYTATGSGPGGLFMGKDFRAAYAPGVSLDGMGQYVALIDGQYFSNDPVIYANDAGIPLPTITNIYVGGSPPGDPPAGTDDGEQSLDISMIMSMAPHATIMVYEGNADACFVQMAIDNKAKQISCSLGWGPASPMLGQEFEEFDAQGQAFFAASGDGGSGGDDSNTSGGGPGAANEYITLVGGTSLTTSGASGPWQSETAWGGSGGAVCVNIPIPSWQQGISMAHNQGSTVYRNFPDVAMQADTDIFFIDDGNGGGVGGTSAAAPLWAGFMALVNQQSALHGNPSVGFLNPAMYAVGKGPGYAAAMHDITTGNNENASFPTMFSAVTGYDLATGWGSPRGQATINALAGTNLAPNFSLTVPSIIGNSVNDLTVGQGSNATIVVTIITGNGFAAGVNLAALDLPSGVTASFSPAGTTGSSTLTFTAAKTAPIGVSPTPVTIVGTGGNLIRTTTLNLRVVAGNNSATADFSLAGLPATLALTTNGSSTSQILVNPLNGFTGSVALSAAGLPSGVTAGFSATTGGGAATFTAGPGAVPGTNTVTITGTSGSLNHSIPITLMVLDPAQIPVPAITNFGFETPVLGSGSNVYNPSGAGWTFGGASPDGSGIMGNSSAFANPNAPQGAQAAFLQEYGTIAQAISGLIPGISYTINFAAAERSSGNTGGETWNVMIDNSVIGSYSPGPAATAYVNYSASFTASATTHTLMFAGTDLATSNNTVFLDNVTIAVSTNQFAVPAVALTSPAGSAVFTAPATIDLAAGVATNGNLVNSVQFYANTTLVAQVTSPPYTYSWTSVSNGSYNIFAQVIYNGGSVVDSTIAQVTVTNTSLNLGFETPSLGAGNYQYNPSGAGWTFSGTGATLPGSGLVANGSALANPAAPEGVQAAFIREQGTISQTLGGFVPGANYTVTYYAAQRPGNAQTWTVLLDNTVIQTENGPGTTSYSIYTANFTASAPVHTLTFVGTDLAGGDNTVFLDNVSVGFNENLGFEIPAVGNGIYQYNPSGGSWTFSGTAGNGSGLIGNGSAFSNPNAPQGSQAAFVQEYGTISQGISGLVPGNSYTITFLAAQRPGDAQSWKVTMNGTTIGTYNPGSGATAYAPYTASFTATAATETLAFVGTDSAGGDNTIFIDAVQINAVAPGAPAAPASLTAKAGNAQVTVSWPAVSGATSYNLVVSTIDGGPYTTLAAVTGTNYVHTGVANGTTYYYEVSAANASGAGANSVQAGATPEPPPPASLTALAGNGQVTLGWPSSTGAISYIIGNSTVNGGPYTAVGNVAGTNFIDTGLNNGTTYYFVVWAMTVSGPTAYSSQASAVPPGPALTTIPNFGFETPNIGSGNTNYEYNPSGGSWTFSGVAGNGSGLIGNGSAFGNPSAPQGSQAAFVQEHGTITQAISGFVPGTNYTLTFLAAERSGNAQSWTVTMNGTTIGSYNPGSSATAYVPYTARFTATAASETLAFVGTDSAGGDNTIFIDDVQIAVTGLTVSPGPQLTNNTTPVTATDVVGSQETFTAGIMAGEPLVYQWQVISGGVTNNIPGATNATLTLANLQLTNTAAYQLVASNMFGTVVTTPASLTVNSVPAAVNNVVTCLANQTGSGSGTFTPTWIATTNNSLIAGQAPSSTAGNFSLEVPGRSVNSLTAGGSLSLTTISGTSGTTTSTNYVTCGNGGGAGSQITYTLAGSVSGFDLTNITVYGGWSDAGRDQQAYTVSYSTVAAPTTFIQLGTVNYLPSDSANAQSATRATLTPASGALATRVAALKFNFTTPSSENGYCGYAQINLYGTPSAQPVRWAVGNGNWDTSTLNWTLLSGGGGVSYVENNLAAFDDSASGSSPITVTLTGSHSPSVLTNNSAKNYVLAGNYAISGGSLVKSGSGTLTLDNGGANGFASVLINNGTVQVGNSDTNGSLGSGSVTNDGSLVFDRTDALSVSAAISGSGSLWQSGGGTLSLNAGNPYTGNTTISAGTLALAGAGAISNSTLIAVSGGATLDVSGRVDQTFTLNSGQTLTGSGQINGNLSTLAGATLNPGDTIGTMPVQGNIALSGGLDMELNRTNTPANDQLASVTGTITGGGTLTVNNLGPALQPGDVFALFNQPVSGFATVSLPLTGTGYGWANNLANNGTLSVVSTVSPSLMPQLGAGNTLTLTWPLDHVGWQLEAQTNSPGQGLGTNWTVVAGSITTNQMSIPVDENNSSVFYRLWLP